MIALVAGKPLHSLLETRFLRSRLRVDTGKSICEVAIDEGEIVTDFGDLPICEMEIELFSGDQRESLRIGKAIADKYQLYAENRSKYAKSLKILEDKKVYIKTIVNIGCTQMKIAFISYLSRLQPA